MLKVSLALAAAGALAAPTLPVETGPNTPYYAGPPPAEYAREGLVPVLFVHPDRVTQLCGGAPAGMVVYACVREAEDGLRIVIMPHPIVARGEFYALLLEHELAHEAGWPGDHPMPEVVSVQPGG